MQFFAFTFSFCLQRHIESEVASILQQLYNTSKSCKHFALVLFYSPERQT